MVLGSQRKVVEISARPNFTLAFAFPPAFAFNQAFTLAFTLTFSTSTEGANIIHKEFLAAQLELRHPTMQLNSARRSGVRNNINCYIANHRSMKVSKIRSIAKVSIHLQVNIAAIISIPETYT